MTDVYKSKTIDIDKTENETILNIDHEKINYDQDPDSKKFFSNSILPYKQFSSLQELAHAIIDNMEDR